MPKLKDAGESLQKTQGDNFEPPSPLTANKTRVQRHTMNQQEGQKAGFGSSLTAPGKKGGSRTGSRGSSSGRSMGLTIDTTKPKEEQKDDQPTSAVLERFSSLRGT